MMNSSKRARLSETPPMPLDEETQKFLDLGYSMAQANLIISMSVEVKTVLTECTRFLTGQIRISDVRKVENDANLAFGSDLDQVTSSNFVFSHYQILEILKHHKGSDILQAIAEHGSDLIAFELTRDDIFKLMGYQNPVEAMAALAADGMELIFLFKYEKMELLNIIFYGGGHKTLPVICKHHTELVAAGFQKEQILALAGRWDAADIIHIAITHHYPIFRNLGIKKIADVMFNIIMDQGATGITLASYARQQKTVQALKRENPAAPAAKLASPSRT